MKLERKALLLAVVGTLLLQLYLCYFFSFGDVIPMTNDINPSNQWLIKYRFPPRGYFSVLDGWLGFGHDPMPFTPYSVLALLPMWMFFTIVYPLGAALGVWTFYLFLRELKLPVAVAIVGGVIYGWQGRTLSNIYGGHIAPPLLSAMLPLAMWAAIRSINRRDWTCALIAGGTTGMMVATAFDQGALAAMPIGIVFLAKAGQALWRKSADALRIGAKLLVTIVVALLVAWPALQLGVAAGVSGIKQAGSEDAKAKFAWATQWSWPPEETLIYLVPGFFGWRSGELDGPYWGRIGQTENWDQTRQGFRNFSLDINTLGTVPFLLLCVGLWAVCRRSRSANAAFAPCTSEQLFYARVLLGLAVVCFLLGFGKYAPFYWLFYQLPYMNTWRNPIKFLIGPGNFCLIALAAFGLHAVIELFSNAQFPVLRRNLRRWFLAATALLALVFLSTIFSGGDQDNALRRAGYTAPEIRSIASNRRLTTFVALGLAAVTCGALGLLDKKPTDKSKPTLNPVPIAAAASAAVAVLVIGQMWWVHTHYLDPFNPKQAYRTNALLETLRPSPDPTRVKLIAQDGLLHYYLSTVFAYHGIATIDIPAASRTPDDYVLFFQTLANDPFRLWQLAGVKYLAAPAAQGQSLLQHPAFQGKIAGAIAFQASGNRLDNLTVQMAPNLSTATHLLIQLKDYLPKATFVPGLEILPQTENEVRRLAATDWNPRQTILVTQADAKSSNLNASAFPSNTSGTVQLAHYGADRIEVVAQTTAGGYLLINDRFEDAWRAQVNGKDAPVFRADLILRGVALPAGNARIVLRYERPALSGYVSLATIGVVVLLGLAQAARRFSAVDFERKEC